SVAAIVGPIGLLCIQRTLDKGFLYGLVTGLGAATADALYGSIAGIGLTALAAFLINQQFWIRLLGGFFIIYLGIRTLLSKPAQRAAVAKTGSFLGAYAITFLLTLTNPQTILAFTGIFAGLGVGVRGGGVLTALVVVSGTFAGSALWWLLLAGGVNLLRRRVTPAWFVWINRIAGSMIVCFGLFALLGLRG
ncbi:MAG: LysE family transporter, partial [Ktedonobacteraceae bacterium]|nr:LysE family transporter [Ktedonobacteraceae bacterium]